MTATFVLVHGAWLGGWCWHGVADTLRAEGHVVHTPTLTGCSEAAQERPPGVDLSTHLNDVSCLVDDQDLQGVRLVGHSYAGAVVRGVAALRPERLAAVVYLDAFTPGPGESVLDLAAWADAARQVAQGQGDGWRMPPPPPALLGLAADDPALARLTAFPMAAFAQPQPAIESPGVPRAYVRCAANPDPTLKAIAARAQTAGWTYREIAAPHCAMLTHPTAVAAVLKGLTRPDRMAEPA